MVTEIKFMSSLEILLVVILLMVIVTYQQVVGRLRVIATVYMKLLVIELT
jgi:hypothetical protein